MRLFNHVVPTLPIDELASYIRFLIISFENNKLQNKSPFLIDKALKSIGGELKSVKRLRSGDLLIETVSSLQTKSFLLAKTFLDLPVSVTPHKTLNTCRGVISESELLGTSEGEILEGFSTQGVTHVRRIKIKRGNDTFDTKHLILTFRTTILPATIKAGYLNCKVRPYIPNPLRCFKCQSCKGNHSASSKNCPKWTEEKQIQYVRVLQKKSYQEARKVIEARTPTSNSSLYSSAVKTPNQIDSQQPVLAKHKVSGVSSVINSPDGNDKTITVKMSEYLALLQIKKSWEDSFSPPAPKKSKRKNNVKKEKNNAQYLKDSTVGGNKEANKTDDKDQFIDFNIHPSDDSLSGMEQDQDDSDFKNKSSKKYTSKFFKKPT
ncbi:hypothetical protein AVEN_177595-1 [Araneus ventricosus]|uniref:Uncharacterized protein n=1 Tax=Araneus ventricosus TaxID=182803 RepID=A0A4Y2M5K5_ARAVE|nr:hypothetical protein AVEN_177582-1 [Araneus ventricosus]GBN20972.1 hypothetical protein AVEN_177595-1 [Araneus ventricosus]